MSHRQAAVIASDRGRFVANLLRLYSAAETPDQDLGRRWYPDAHAIVCEWALEYSRTVANVAAVVSALSPKCQWERNLIVAADMLAGYGPSISGPLHVNVRKAQTLLDTGSHDIASVFKCAPKVASFACNLAGVYDVVTVDTHAAQAMRNDVLSTDGLTLPLYAECARVYSIAASHVGLLPAEFQAICWLTWKRRYPTGEKIRRRSQFLTRVTGAIRRPL